MHRHIRASAIVLVLALLPGCAALPAILSAVAVGSKWLGSILDVADAGSDAYYARHPNAPAEDKVREVLLRARLAQAALDGAIAAGEAVDAGEVERAKTEALAAYKALRELLDESGILDARADGGAETDAIAPKPFALPTADEVAARL